MAFPLTEGDNIDSWGWVLACIKTKVTRKRGLCVISDRYPGIMVAKSDVHLSWSEPYVYHRVCMRHLASNFMTRFKDKILKNLMCKAALVLKIKKIQ